MSEQGALPREGTCSTHNQRVTEDAVTEEEADLAKEEADEVRLMRETPNFSKKAGTNVECSVEGELSRRTKRTKQPCGVHA